ncbi:MULTISPECIES: GNAT family N-acetyltransferase [Paenibacillus]|uniref:GNAT family N-acetyltransferase n=1 Tax=Paenibacillus ottowii TaxID=2315729 RepID=A0ABY3BAB6_9BACL|nr:MULTISPECIES: GNAT family N-acetyltransferase [Paenibacillus]KZE73271.1 GCN5 family acetyltransferase [Paenibacillus jamilae]OBA07933.1 GCN5 family acetyltransferase [Paenibacillus polymyxa]TQS01301.1 GNAT family N-acetyltransferase [Paenibacillus ottowii]
MIRKRCAQDDKMIFRLIEQELVPLSHLSLQEMDQIRKELPRRLNRGITFVACRPDNAQVVGFIHVMLHGELLYIDLIAIASAHQGKRYGKKLLECAEQYGRLRRCKRAKVMVDEDNVRGIHFYLRHRYHMMRYVALSRCHELEKSL